MGEKKKKQKESKMKRQIDWNSLVPSDQMKGEDRTETIGLKRLLAEATKFLSQFKWCKAIIQSSLGIGVPGVVGVFLFRIEPTSDDVDDLLWVVVGDLPPAYLVTDEAPNPALALDCYVDEMNKWVEAVKAGKPTTGLIPVNASATLEYAKMLQSRLRFLRREILPYFKKQLKT